MAVKHWTQDAAQAQIEYILGIIKKASAHNKESSKEKLGAIMTVERGISSRKFEEYVSALINSGKILRDGDSLISSDSIELVEEQRKEAELKMLKIVSERPIAENEPQR